jgi:hypothetical protein
MTGRPGNTMSIKLRGEANHEVVQTHASVRSDDRADGRRGDVTGGTVLAASASAQSTTAPAPASTPPPTKVQANLTGWVGMSVKPRNIYFGQGGAPYITNLAWSYWHNGCERPGVRPTARAGQPEVPSFVPVPIYHAVRERVPIHGEDARLGASDR